MKIPNYHTSIPSAVLAALALSVTTSAYAGTIDWQAGANSGDSTTWNTTNQNWITATATPWAAYGNTASLGNAAVTLGSAVRVDGFSGSGSIGASSAQFLRLGGAGATSTFSGTIGSNVGFVWDNSSILNLSGINNSTNQSVFRNGGTLRISSATAWTTTSVAKLEGDNFTVELAAADLRINTTNMLFNNSGFLTTAVARFAAIGDDRTVRYTGVNTANNAPATTLNWNGSGGFIGGTLGLGNANSTGKLIWASDINLNGGSGSVLTRKVNAINGSLGAIGGEIAGIISDDGTVNAIFEKTGTGTLVFSASNTYAGETKISQGTLAIGANERIANASNLVLSGGTLDLGGFKETLGTLQLTANSGLNLGEGGQAIFGDSSGVSWTGDLTIAGSFVSGSSIKFGSTTGGLALGQLNRLAIAGFTVTGLDANGFLLATSAIPEPSTFAALAGLGVLGFAACRRRRSV